MFSTFDSNYGARDGRVLDSAGAFLQGELERLDQTLHMPIANVTWTRDIDIRSDVTLADEYSSFANLTFASSGGVVPNGKAWISKNANAITGVDVDTAKQINPLLPWGMEIKYSILELESSLKVNRPVDNQKYEGMKLKYNMDIDEQVYIGDTSFGVTGLVNSSQVTATNVPNGAGGSPLWPTKTAAEILTDINAVISSAWLATGFTLLPSKLLLPPLKFGLINQLIVSTAGNQSLLEYLRKNTLTYAQTGRELEIQPVKWLNGRGAGGTDRMVVYTQDPIRARIPITTLQNTPVQSRGIDYFSYYYGRIGAVELTNTELVAYADGI